MLEKAKPRRKALPMRKDREPVPRVTFRGLRLSRGSQVKMAQELDLTEITIRKIEAGIGDPSLMMAFVYANYFGVGIEELFPDVAEEARKYFDSLKRKFVLVQESQ